MSLFRKKKIESSSSPSETGRGGAAGPGQGKVWSPRRKFLFVALYILGLLLLVEVTARVTWRVLDITWGLVVPQDISRFDDTYGWSLQPGASSVSKATGRLVRYSINAKGLRGPEVPYDKPAGEFRVVFLGDSHTFGFGVPEQARFSQLIEGYFHGLRAVNMGVSGYGIDQELLTLEREGLKYRPDMVIVYVPHFADLRHLKDMIWGMGKPRFHLVDGRLVTSNLPVANNSWLHATALDLDRVFSHWSRAYLMLRDAVVHFVVTRERFDTNPTPAQRAEAEVLGEAIIKKMHAVCKEHGATFVLVTSLDPLAQAARQCGILSLDVRRSMSNSALHLVYDPTKHPNEAANGILAWDIADYLLTNHLVPEANQKPTLRQP